MTAVDALSPVAMPPGEATERRVEHLLGDLIRICRDAEENYRAASERDKSALLQTKWLRRSYQRAGFAAALQTLLRRHGVEAPADSGSLVGALHRKWLEWRDGLSPGDGTAVVDEMQRAEHATIKAYRDILNDYPVGLYPEDAAVIAFQLRECERTLDELQSVAAANAG
ncbi:MAG TPA: PA2169 family four-helix-bundle protein [Luteolibacter sp.]